MSEWKPIETAPKTDDPILVAYDNGDVELVTDSDETDWEPYTGKGAIGNGIICPTHWMPVPAAPFQRTY